MELNYSWGAIFMAVEVDIAFTRFLFSMHSMMRFQRRKEHSDWLLSKLRDISGELMTRISSPDNEAPRM